VELDAFIYLIIIIIFSLNISKMSIGKPPIKNLSNKRLN